MKKEDLAQACLFLVVVIVISPQITQTIGYGSPPSQVRLSLVRRTSSSAV